MFLNDDHRTDEKIREEVMMSEPAEGAHGTDGGLCG